VALPIEVIAAAVSVVVGLAVAPTGGAAGLACLAVTLVFLASATQLLPLPPSLHGASPGARSLFQTSLEPLGLYPSWRPLSLDPAASGRALLVASGTVAAFWAAWALGTAHRRRDLLIQALAGSGALATFIVMGAALFGAGRLLAPSTTFVNPNHLAGFLCLTSFPALGLALRSRGPGRLGWLAAFALAGTTVFLTLSRGGVGAFLGGIAVFGLLAVRRREGVGSAGPRRWWLAGGLTAVLAVASFLALDPVLAELRTVARAGEDAKVSLWRPAIQLLRDYPLTGIGRGAFSSVFPGYKTETEQVTFTHLENEWVQPLIDLGLPFGLLLVLTLAWTWLSAALRRDLSWTDVGLLAGTSALAAQNTVDFSLEVSSVALPFMVALGLLARGAGSVALRATVARLALAFVGLVGAGGLAVWLLQPPVDAAVEAQVAWRPADFLPHATEGVRLASLDHCAAAMPWLNRAMLLGPNIGEPHRFAARCLAADGQHALARREYRLALMLGAPGILPEAAARYPSAAALKEVVPDSADGRLQLGRFFGRERPTEAAAAFREALDEFLDERAVIPLAQATLAAGDSGEALALAERRARETPADIEAWRLGAAIHLQEGRVQEAATLASRGLQHNPGAPPLISLLVETALRARRFGEAHRIAEQMSIHGPADLAARHHLIARALAGQGRGAEAIAQARSAAAALPRDPVPQLIVATYCEQAGRLDDAIAAVERAMTLSEQPDLLAERLAALRRAQEAQRARRLRDSILEP